MAFALHGSTTRERGRCPGAAPLAMFPSTINVALLLVPLAVCFAASGCLYTGRINSRPKVKIVPPAPPFARGQTVAIDAVFSDSDGDRLQFSWTVIPGACTPAPDPSKATAGSTSPPPFMFQLPHDAATTFCVWVQVTDSFGAQSAFDFVPLNTVNQRPVAAIDVQVPSTPNAANRYDLYSRFRVSAAGSSDPDGDAIATRRWTYTFPFQTPPPPLQAPSEPVPCSPTSPQDLVVCFDATDPGDYAVGLTVSDGLDDSMPATIVLRVDADHPLCVSSTQPATNASPLVLDPAEPKTFAVTGVIDDGSSLPAPTDGRPYTAPTFAWSLRRNDPNGPWEDLVGYDGQASLTLAAGTYVSGDTVDVRVVVSDGQEANHAVTMTTCDASCPPGCPSTAVWTVEYR